MKRKYLKEIVLGTGVHSTTKIILESLHRYNEEIQLINSDYFIMPNLMYSRTKGVLSERLTTLSQIFLELEDKKLSPFTMHYQIYTYNDLYIRAMHNLLGPLFFIAKPFLLPLLERLIVVQGYIHSDHSSTMMAKLTTEGNQSLYKVRGVVNSESRKLMKGMAKKLRKYHRELGFHPMTWLQRPGLPGGGCHSGGSFPMSKMPTGLESDRLGRTGGLKRTHIVDSSIFPTIPATTITFTSMANSHRIATEVSQGKGL